MAKKEKRGRKDPEKRPARIKLSAAESLKRMEDINKRKESMIAAVRKSTN